MPNKNWPPEDGDVTHLIERLDALEDRESVRFEALYALFHRKEERGQTIVWPLKVEKLWFDPFQKKAIVYFGVSVANLSGPQEAHLNPGDFTLEDSQGNSYSCEPTTDWITGKLHLGKTGRGDIAFAIYYGSTPQKLLYDTGYVDSFSREKLFASADSLDKLKIFKKPLTKGL